MVKGRADLAVVLAKYDLDDIFNIDETGLFFRLGPNYTLASHKVKGTKLSKERITVALCANATGTIKIKPFVIAKSKRPRSFGISFDPEVYVRYRNNKKAWMTRDLFTDWFVDFDWQMHLKKRKVIRTIQEQ